MAIICDNPDLHVSSGSVSSMPGSSHSFPEGSMCDRHPTVRAIARIQGETDSFGCEYHLMCQACLNEDREHSRRAYEEESFCDWCKTRKTHCAPRRDYEEGMGGPVYNVCRDCANKENDRINEELADMDDRYGPISDYDDYHHDDDFDDEPLEEWRVIDSTIVFEDGHSSSIWMAYSECEAQEYIKSLAKENRENYYKMVDGAFSVAGPY